MNLPKPEPFQLLSLSFFFFYLQKNDFSFGKYWIFLGLAIGAKISILFLVPAFYCLCCFNNKLPENKIDILKKSIPAVLFFIIGWMIAEPLIFRGLFKPSSYMTFLQEVKNNASHGADILSINFLDWFNFIFSDYFPGNKWCNFSIFLVIGIYLVKNFRSFYLDKSNLSLVIVFSLMFCPIVLLVNRLWGIYLHIPFVILFILLLRLYQNKEIFYSNNIKKLVYAFVIILMSLGLYAQSKNISDIISKEESFEHILKQREYLLVLSIIETLNESLKRNIECSVDPNLYIIEDIEKVRAEQFWGAFIDWEKNKDLIVFYNHSILKMYSTPKDGFNYKKQIFAKSLFEDNVLNADRKYVLIKQGRLSICVKKEYLKFLNSSDLQ